MNEPLRYLANAKELLSKSPIEDDTYLDMKYVQEACSTAYLAVLKAVDEYLKFNGVSQKEMPESVEAYREALKKYLTPHNGRLSREFEKIYTGLHIAGYYRGLINDVNVLKDYFKIVKNFIEKITV